MSPRPRAVGVQTIACVMAAASAVSPTAHGQVYPPGFTSTTIGTGMPFGATCMAPLPDGRVLVAIKSGVLRLVNADGTLAPANVHAFTGLVQGGEAGFIGLTIAPDFASTGHVFCHVSRTSPTRAEIVRLQIDPPTASVSTGVETVLVPLTASGGIHQGGQLRVGPDGCLYVTLGDNGNGANSQLLTTRLGKVLRYQLDGGLPTDNPTSFAGVAGAPTGDNRAIWCLGLRNPFTFAIQRETGRMHINDVGAGSREEVNAGGAGLNFGWPTTEGDFNPAQFPNFTRPLVAYPRTGALPSGGTIAGATFYNPVVPNLPASYTGDYFFGDYQTGFVMRRDTATGEMVPLVSSGLNTLVALEVDAQGRLLVLRGGYSNTFLQRVSFGRCGLADITDVGGGGGGGTGDSDKQITVDDLILFVNLFSHGAGCPAGVAGSPCNPADLTGLGGPPSVPDGQLTVDDLVAFVNGFVEGC